MMPLKTDESKMLTLKEDHIYQISYDETVYEILVTKLGKPEEKDYEYTTETFILSGENNGMIVNRKTQVQRKYFEDLGHKSDLPQYLL